MGLFEETFEKCAALCVGLTALAFGAPPGAIEGSIAASGLVAFVIGRRSRFGPESPQIMGRISATIRSEYSEFLNADGGGGNAQADLDAANISLQQALRRCAVDREKLARAAISTDGFVEAATALVLKSLAVNEPELFGDAAASSIHFRFARDVLRAGFAAAITDEAYYRSIEPTLIFELAAAIGDVRATSRRIEERLSTLSKDTSAAFVNTLKDYGILPENAKTVEEQRQLIAALKAADRLKDDFVQSVSYELRSPLTNIIGFSELLRLPQTGYLNDRQEEYLKHIGSSASVLLNIVNDILDLATVDAGIMRLDRVKISVRTIIVEVADWMGSRFADYGIELKIDIENEEQEFVADLYRVRQILANLLTNASNHAPEGSIVILSCRRQDNHIAFTVHDEGPGIPAEIVDQTIKAQRGEGRSRGAGLGLSIVKSFTELHGGAVKIDSGPGRGTTVTCRFPISPPDK